MLKVLYHQAKFGGARISPANAAAKNVEFFVGLSVCLSVTVTLVNDGDSACNFTIKELRVQKRC